MALSKTYTSFAVARVFAGLASGFSQTVPPSTIADIYRKEVRGDKMAVFGVFVIVSVTTCARTGGSSSQASSG
jgi:MFS family permease